MNLGKLKQCTNQIIKSLTEAECAGCHSAINWGNLICTSARVAVDDSGDVTLEVLIEEAAPDDMTLENLSAASSARLVGITSLC